jgi:hypothetical protein
MKALRNESLFHLKKNNKDHIHNIFNILNILDIYIYISNNYSGVYQSKTRV